MRRVISSGWTMIFKVVVPLALVALSVVLVLGLFAYSSKLPGDAVVGTLLTLGATVFFCWWRAKLKQVSMDDRNLYVSNWIKEVSIPLFEIDSVDDLQGGCPVIVRLKARSEFGRTILFWATWKPILFRTHPIVEELRELIRSQFRPSSWKTRTPEIVITLRSPSVFGQRIRFAPKYFSVSDVADELRQYSSRGSSNT